MKTIVYIEKNPTTNKLRDVSVELAYKAHSLMKPFAGEVVGVFAGDVLPENSEELFQYGVNRLIHYTNPKLSNIQSIAYKNIIEHVAINQRNHLAEKSSIYCFKIKNRITKKEKDEKDKQRKG